MAPGCRKSGSVSNSLSNKRSEYILSTKVGRLILDEVEDASTPDLGEKGDIFKNGRPNKIVYDYTGQGAKKSIGDSLRRMNVDHIDTIHKNKLIARTWPGHWRLSFEICDGDRCSTASKPSSGGRGAQHPTIDA